MTESSFGSEHFPIECHSGNVTYYGRPILSNRQAIMFYSGDLFIYYLLCPPYGIGQTIVILPCGLFFYLLSIFFLAYSQPSQIRCLPYFHTWCGLSENLGCRSETCSTRLAGNTGRKKSSKFAIWAPSHNILRFIS